MKYLLCFLLTLTLATSGFIGRCQCPSNRSQLEITASYGLVSSNDLIDELSTTKSTKNKTHSNSGIPFATVRYFLFNRLALGFSGGIAEETGNYQDYYSTSMTTTYKKTYTTIALELYYIYTFRKRLEVYTFAGLGPGTTNIETTTYQASGAQGIAATSKDSKLKGQYTPLGIRFGGRFGGFAEIGIGYKGLVNVGLSCKFGSPCWWKQ